MKIANLHDVNQFSSGLSTDASWEIRARLLVVTTSPLRAWARYLSLFFIIFESVDRGIPKCVAICVRDFNGLSSTACIILRRSHKLKALRLRCGSAILQDWVASEWVKVKLTLYGEFAILPWIWSLSVSLSYNRSCNSAFALLGTRDLLSYNRISLYPAFLQPENAK